MSTKIANAGSKTTSIYPMAAANPAPLSKMTRQTGVNIETIRYFEKIGVMPAPGRSEGGNRLYKTDHRQRLFFFNRCREIGFNQGEIKALLFMVDNKGVTCAEVHAITIGHIADIRQKIRDLTKMETVLMQMANKCSQGDLPEYSIIETLFAVQA